MPRVHSEQPRARKPAHPRQAQDGKPHTLHDLQRLAGNAAVTALIEERLKVQRWGAIAPPVAAPAAAAVAPPTLKPGDTGPEVESLQKKLNGLGAALTEDGNFGWRTKAAVTSLQSDVGVKVSGTVDADTWTAITTAKAGSLAAVGLGRQERWKTWIPWAGLSRQQRQDWTTLGWNAATWRSKTPPTASSKRFRALTDAERAAAVRLGYTPASWDARRDVTAANAAAAYAEEEARAKKKAGKKAGKSVLPARWIGSLHARSILDSQFGGYTKITLPKMEVLTASEMAKKYDGFYGAGSYATDGPLEGFNKDGVNYLNIESQSVDTEVHEMLHAQAHADWKAFAKENSTHVNEGATELLTHDAVSAHGFTPSTSYADQDSLVEAMNRQSSFEQMKKALFKGGADVTKYKADVAAGLKTGKTWAVFQGHYDHGRFAAAIACLK